MNDLTYNEYKVLERACSEGQVRIRGGGCLVGEDVSKSLLRQGLLETLDGIRFAPTGDALVALQIQELPAPPPRPVFTDGLSMEEHELALIEICERYNDCIMCAGAGYNEAGVWCDCYYGRAPNTAAYRQMVEEAKKRLKELING